MHLPAVFRGVMRPTGQVGFDSSLNITPHMLCYVFRTANKNPCTSEPNGYMVGAVGCSTAYKNEVNDEKKKNNPINHKRGVESEPLNAPGTIQTRDKDGTMNKNIAPRRRQQHVGVLSDGIWSAHDRGLENNGVLASTNINTSTDFDDFESFITRRWASEARELSKNLATGTPLNRERLGMALDNLAAIAEREANRNGAVHE